MDKIVHGLGILRYYLSVSVLCCLFFPQQAVAQSANDGWIMVSAPAPYRAQISYVQAGREAYALTCKVGSPREVQQWVDGVPSEGRARIELVGPRGMARLSSMDHTSNPRTSLRTFDDEDEVRLVSEGVELPSFQWQEFDAAYLAFHKSCQRGFSLGSVPTFNCAMPQDREARAVCRSPELARMQRAAVVRYEQFTRDLSTVEEQLEAWRLYTSHMDDVNSCHENPDSDCYYGAYQTFLMQLGEPSTDAILARQALKASPPDEQLVAEMTQHGFTGARGLGSLDELHFIETSINGREAIVVMHDVAVDEDVDPNDERLLIGASLLAAELTPPAQVSLHHIVKGHPVTPGAAGAAGIPDLAHTRLTISWKDGNVDTIITRFGRDRGPVPVSAQYVLAETSERVATAQENAEIRASNLSRMREELQSSLDAIEAEKARTAASAGLVYRSPAFWSNVDDADARRIFEGEQAAPILALRQLTGWLAAKAAHCTLHGVLHEMNWPDGPAIRSILVEDPEGRIFPEQPILIVEDEFASLFAIAAEPALVSEHAVARSLQDPMIAQRVVGAERGAARLLRVAGCDTATAQQFQDNIIRLLRGAPSLQTDGVRLENAERESDDPPT